jgi:hypothetical protein
MADLKPVIIDNSLYVTTKEKAEKLIDDEGATPVPLGHGGEGGGA